MMVMVFSVKVAALSGSTLAARTMPIFVAVRMSARRSAVRLSTSGRPTGGELPNRTITVRSTMARNPEAGSLEMKYGGAIAPGRRGRRVAAMVLLVGMVLAACSQSTEQRLVDGYFEEI